MVVVNGSLMHIPQFFIHKNRCMWPNVVMEKKDAFCSCKKFLLPLKAGSNSNNNSSNNNDTCFGTSIIAYICQNFSSTIKLVGPAKHLGL